MVGRRIERFIAYLSTVERGKDSPQYFQICGRPLHRRSSYEFGFRPLRPTTNRTRSRHALLAGPEDETDCRYRAAGGCVASHDARRIGC